MATSLGLLGKLAVRLLRGHFIVNRRAVAALLYFSFDSISVVRTSGQCSIKHMTQQMLSTFMRPLAL